MRDFYATSGNSDNGPLDQADGLRRMFEGRSPAVLALAANPHVSTSGSVLHRVAQALVALGRQVLVVDAAGAAPPASELTRLDLAAGVELLAPGVAYLAARGLPLAHVDTRGSAARFISALHEAVPSADVLLLHADAGELVRMLVGRAARPLLLAADHPESLKHAYAAAKLLHARTRLATFDFLLSASTRSPRVRGIASSLSSCVENFLGGLLNDWALIDSKADPAGDPPGTDPEHGALHRLLRAQLALDCTLPAAGGPAADSGLWPRAARAENR